MRLDRALEKLNRLLSRRGITSTASALATTLAAHAGAAAPAQLAASVTGAALNASVVTSGTAAVFASFTVMSKMKLAVASAIVVAGLTTVVIEVQANRALRAELGSGPTDDFVVLQKENQRLRAEMAGLGVRNPDVAEYERMQNRVAVLKARPPGVVDAELRAPRNLGRATPAAAIETFCWAIDQGDLDFVASFMTLVDDSNENRAAFMAQFSPVARERYRTPERLCAAAFFGSGLATRNSLPAMQVVSVTQDHGPDQVKIKLWFRGPDGRESAGGDTFVRRPDGWAGKSLSILRPDLARNVGERINPATGDYIPLRPTTVSSNR